MNRCVNHYIFSKHDCQLANGTFYYPSVTKEDCLSYLYCWSPQSTITGLMTPPNPQTGNCSDGETMRSLFQWEEAKWIGGTWASTMWTTRRAVTANDIRTSIDFLRLQSAVSFSSSLSQKTFFQNQVRSRKYTPKDRASQACRFHLTDENERDKRVQKKKIRL